MAEESLLTGEELWCLHWLHYRHQNDWSVATLAKKMREDYIEEMEHVDKLIGYSETACLALSQLPAKLVTGRRQEAGRSPPRT